VPELKVGSLLWKLIANYCNFRTIFLSFKPVGHGGFFRLIYFATILEASEMIYSTPTDMQVATFGRLSTVGRLRHCGHFWPFGLIGCQYWMLSGSQQVCSFSEFSVILVLACGFAEAVPRKILDIMNVQGLTRENVASHLQVSFRMTT